jgi:hypothetical protein
MVEYETYEDMKHALRTLEGTEFVGTYTRGKSSIRVRDGSLRDRGDRDRDGARAGVGAGGPAPPAAPMNAWAAPAPALRGRGMATMPCPAGAAAACADAPCLGVAVPPSRALRAADGDISVLISVKLPTGMER